MTMAKLHIIPYALMTLLFCIGVLSNEIVYEMNEEEEINYYIGNVSRDSNISQMTTDQVFNTLQYSFVSGPGIQYFKLDNRTGLLYTNRRLDRDTLCEFSENCVFQFSVMMKSGAFLKSVPVKVLLLDINDNWPEFPVSSVSFLIPESASVGRSYSLPKAEDKDLGVNSLRNYSIEPPSGHFRLTVERLVGGLKPSLVINSPLDRESQSSYQLFIIAIDGGNPPKTRRLLVNITIQDANDHSPVFSSLIYNVNVSETIRPNSTIIAVSAFDDDIGANGDVVYRLSRQQQSVDVKSTFQIDPHTGEITPTRRLNHLQGQTIRVVVEALDRNSEPRVAQATVLITVLDTVNNRPQIQLSVFREGIVIENASIGEVVAHIIVTDEDSGNNGQVNCSLNTDRFGLMAMGENEYKMIVSALLDREMFSSLNVTISCQDRGTSPLSSFKSFVVTLQDINDNFPVFQQNHYLFSIFENNEVHNLIGFVKATDRDTGRHGRVRYKVAPRDQHVLDYIAIDSETGDIRATVSLDRETTEHFNFTVVASDNGMPPLSSIATVYINIKDINDNTPSFPGVVYRLNIYENRPAHSNVGVIVANDPDLGDNGVVSYFMLNNDNFSIPFNVTENGSVTSSKTFDREFREVYTFDVIARDHGTPALTDIVRVYIQIRDENDNTPEIIFPNAENNTVRIPYQSPPGSRIARITGTDADSGVNGKLSYSILMQPNNKMFSVEKTTGTIFVDKNLDLTECGSHIVYVWASDGGEPAKTSSRQALEIVVFVGNTTVLPSSQGEQNALIVIVLLCVTVIVAAIVLSVVLKMRRNDRQKKAGNSSLQMETLSRNPPSYKDVTDSGFVDLATYGDINELNDDALKPPKTKQESKEDLILFKMQLAEQYKQREQDQIESPTSFPCTDLHQMATEHGLPDDVTNPNETRLVAMKVQQALLQCSQRAPQHTQSLRNKVGCNNDNMADEILSDTSGETTGTDSGRGFSEEDSHSQGRGSLPSETDENCFANMRLPFNNYQNVPNTKPPNRFQFHRHSSPPCSNDDSGVQATSILRNTPRCQTMNRADKTKPYTVHFDSTPYHIEPVYRRPHNSFIETMREGENARLTRNLMFRKGSTGFSIDTLNDSVDDDNTTTSGSYTIDHDDIHDDVIVFGLQDVYV